MEPKTSLE